MRAVLLFGVGLAASGCGGRTRIELSSPVFDGGTTATPDGTGMNSDSNTGTGTNTATGFSVGAEAGLAADSSADSGPCVIMASNYDQSCSVDGDCASVWSGDYCMSGCECPNSAINSSSVAQYDRDIVNATASAASAVHLCPASNGFCPLTSTPCCRHGVCQPYGACQSQSLVDTLPACADAGGACLFGPSCFPAGPPDSCAYADETCCVIPPPR